VTPDARELHRVITASVRELLETARLEAQAGQRGAVNRGAARRAAPEYRPGDVGGLPGGASAMTRHDLARLLEEPGE
jgi:hypothetical protein